jgi:hypothetical protein
VRHNCREGEEGKVKRHGNNKKTGTVSKSAVLDNHRVGRAGNKGVGREKQRSKV